MRDDKNNLTRLQKLEQLYDAVRNMRHWQDLYHRRREPDHQQYARSAQREVDRLVGMLMIDQQRRTNDQVDTCLCGAVKRLPGSLADSDSATVDDI